MIDESGSYSDGCDQANLRGLAKRLNAESIEVFRKEFPATYHSFQLSPLLWDFVGSGE